nr:hemerythrin domain-containing protein [uncultured Roseateles sp.]
MALTLPGHNAPAVGFEVPLETLAACHGRVKHQCETLRRLVTHLQNHGVDRAAQEAAGVVMRYFDTAAHHHHEDEEQDLFPALLESMAGSDAVCLRELTASLCSDHRLLEQRWAALRQRLSQVAQGATSTMAGADIPGFVQLYEQHIAREEAELLPMATRLLSDVELDRIGRAMRHRRGGTAVDSLRV